MTSLDTAGKKALVEHFFATLSSLKPDDWIKNWTDDGIFDQPYAFEGYPARLEGIDAIYNHVRSIDKVFSVLTFHDLELTATEDPDLILATLRSEGEVIATGKRYVNEYIALLRIRGDKISHYREFFNPLNILDAFGGDEALDTLNEGFHIEG